MTKEYYIASRASWSAMNKAAGSNVSRLNQSMSQTLRKGANTLGIKQNTREGGRLEFYCVSQEQFDTLTDEGAKIFSLIKGNEDVRPLLWLERQAMVDKIKEVNGRYPSRFPNTSEGNKLHSQYKLDLKTSIEGLMTKLADDVRVERTKEQNPGFKVGDMITHWEWRETFPAVITKITAASYQYQVYVPKNGRFRTNDPKALAEHFVGATGWGNDWDGSFEMPFAANRDAFVLNPKKITRRWHKIGTEVPGQTDAMYKHTWYTD